MRGHKHVLGVLILLLLLLLIGLLLFRSGMRACSGDREHNTVSIATLRKFGFISQSAFHSRVSSNLATRRCRVLLNHTCNGKILCIQFFPAIITSISPTLAGQCCGERHLHAPLSLRLERRCWSYRLKCHRKRALPSNLQIACTEFLASLFHDSRSTPSPTRHSWMPARGLTGVIFKERNRLIFFFSFSVFFYHAWIIWAVFSFIQAFCFCSIGPYFLWYVTHVEIR